MKIARIALPGLVLLLAGCQTSQKSRTTCEDDVTALRVAIFETSTFLEEVRPQIQDGFEALERCDTLNETCSPAEWLGHAQVLRRDHRIASSNFQGAVGNWTPDACVAHIQALRINPPKPSAYQGYHYTLDETEAQIEELISKFSKRV